MSVTPYMPVYRRAETMMVRGEGCALYDSEGVEYLDFATGIAVNALGHNHPHVCAALESQAKELWYCSNLFCHPQLERFSERLVGASFADSAFFCSSGTEAVEAAIKFARYYHHAHGHSERNRIITFENGFHGRSMAAISAGGNPIAREGFAPLLDGFDRVPHNDLAAVEAAITDKTAAIFIEPIQGEGGVHAASLPFLQGLRMLCDDHGLLLMLDEVQCGMGRPGSLFAYEHYGITPDILTTAKGIGNGFPLAACLATETVALALKPGVHGSTYGSNPLAMAVGNAVLDVMLEDGFFSAVKTTGASLMRALEVLVGHHPQLFMEVRGMGLMLGLQMGEATDHRAFATHLRGCGLLVAPSYGNVLRILPPLIINQQHIDEAVEKLDKAAKTYVIANDD